MKERGGKERSPQPGAFSLLVLSFSAASWESVCYIRNRISREATCAQLEGVGIRTPSCALQVKLKTEPTIKSDDSSNLTQPGSRTKIPNEQVRFHPLIRNLKKKCSQNQIWSMSR